jgi:hypothetical protein
MAQQDPPWKYHTFLSHSWGANDKYHNRVKAIHEELKTYNLTGWFDEYNMSPSGGTDR